MVAWHEMPGIRGKTKARPVGNGTRKYPWRRPSLDCAGPSAKWNLGQISHTVPSGTDPS
jgi:hypothetical protein